jgi:hypothetical protein
LAPVGIAPNAVPASASFTGEATPRSRATIAYTTHAATTAPPNAYQT